jgi:hypothetical protein
MPIARPGERAAEPLLTVDDPWVWPGDAQVDPI